MLDYSLLETELCECLDLRRRPVAVTFGEGIPLGIARFEGVEPSGCSFWQRAAGGKTFYTLPDDHYGCAMGAYTHRYELAPERACELEQELSRMTSSGYLKMEEIPLLPRLKQAPKAVIYAPLGATPGDPDLVIIAARPAQVVILQEAALRTGAGLHIPPFGRPACIALAAALSQGLVTSAGCLGNRIYAGLADDELYAILPGRALGAVTQEVKAVAESSSIITDRHRARLEQRRPESALLSERHPHINGTDP